MLKATVGSVPKAEPARAQHAEKYRRSGSNRHGALAPPDFESENPPPGASYHVLVRSVGMPKNPAFAQRDILLCPTPF